MPPAPDSSAEWQRSPVFHAPSPPSLVDLHPARLSLLKQWVDSDGAVFQGVSSSPPSTPDSRAQDPEQEGPHSKATPTCRPTRHVQTCNKLLDWGLTVRNKVVIMVDSNLSRFPPVQQDDVQVDGYPGATFQHAAAILCKTTCHVNPTKAIPSFGIGSRSHEPGV